MNRKKYLLLALLLTMVTAGEAQPPARRAEAAAKVQKTNANNLTLRAKLTFPTANPVSEDVVWRRDVYRELRLDDAANVGLAYPVVPEDGNMNLFTLLFKLMMAGPARGGVNVYQYRLDGQEHFTDDARIKPLTFLDDHHIFYEKTDKGVHIDNSDIPSAEVKRYYIKESAYYDQTTASFHRKVVALCPILERDDDFGHGTTSYPLFWVRYDDVAPALAKQRVRTSALNQAETMSLADFFTLHLYRGKIYKTDNLLGQMRPSLGNDSTLTQEQRRIEQEIATFESRIWGDPARKDPADSMAAQQQGTAKASRKREERKPVAAPKRLRRGASQKAAGSTPARVSVRRERH